uniref:Dynein light chain n=1 Tax=Ditylenchus dipsaci TaxID=166011 RepID=A0A915CQE1_9BILA
MAEQSQLSLTDEAVQGVCKKVLDEVIGQSNYEYSESGNWTKLATEKITEALVSLKSNSKFCVCCSTMQNGLGAGLNVSSTCYWTKPLMPPSALVGSLMPWL